MKAVVGLLLRKEEVKRVSKASCRGSCKPYKLVEGEAKAEI
jgi:hypothetical protein